MSPLLWYLASLALHLYSAVARPSSARCVAPAALLTGVQRDGSFTCWYDAPRAGGEWPPRDYVHGAAIDGRVWCSGAQVPTTDGERVWCAQRGGAAS